MRLKFLWYRTRGEHSNRIVASGVKTAPASGGSEFHCFHAEHASDECFRVHHFAHGLRVAFFGDGCRFGVCFAGYGPYALGHERGDWQKSTVSSDTNSKQTDSGGRIGYRRGQQGGGFYLSFAELGLNVEHPDGVDLIVEEVGFGTAVLPRRTIRRQ